MDSVSIPHPVLPPKSMVLWNVLMGSWNELWNPMNQDEHSGYQTQTEEWLATGESVVVHNSLFYLNPPVDTPGKIERINTQQINSSTLDSQFW